MLSFAHLLDADACPTCPTCPTYENEVGQPVSPGMAGVSPTCPTCPTEKQQLHTNMDAGAETPFSLEPLPGQWECPTGYARHREFWTSDYGLRICAICHPQPGKGGAA